MAAARAANTTAPASATFATRTNCSHTTSASPGVNDNGSNDAVRPRKISSTSASRAVDVIRAPYAGGMTENSPNPPHNN